MGTFERTKEGRLKCSTLDLELIFAEFYETARTEMELDWIHEQLESVNEISYEERLNDIEED